MIMLERMPVATTLGPIRDFHCFHPSCLIVWGKTHRELGILICLVCGQDLSKAPTTRYEAGKS